MTEIKYLNEAELSKNLKLYHAADNSYVSSAVAI